MFPNVDGVNLDSSLWIWLGVLTLPGWLSCPLWFRAGIRLLLHFVGSVGRVSRPFSWLAWRVPSSQVPVPWPHRDLCPLLLFLVCCKPSVPMADVWSPWSIFYLPSIWLVVPFHFLPLQVLLSWFLNLAEGYFHCSLPGLLLYIWGVVSCFCSVCHIDCNCDKPLKLDFILYWMHVFLLYKAPSSNFKV